MSHPRFTVVPGANFDNQLAAIWLKDRNVTAAIDRLDEVLQILPDQAGTSFEYDGRSYWYIRHNGFQVIYQIMSDDCLVQLHDIRPLVGS